MDVSTQHGEPDRAVEQLLRRSVPPPGRDFKTGLERRLFGAPRTAAAHRTWRPAFAGAALAGGFAAAAVALSLAGVGPLAGSNGGGASATTHCAYVTGRHVEKVPRIVTDAAGNPKIRYERRVVTAPVRRCR
jgi:hypothetical protein